MFLGISLYFGVYWSILDIICFGGSELDIKVFSNIYWLKPNILICWDLPRADLMLILAPNSNIGIACVQDFLFCADMFFV